MAKYGAWAIVLSRWIPGVPGDPVSYAAGITHWPLVPFIVLTVIGLLPADFVTACLGTETASNVPLPYWILGWLCFGLACLVWYRRPQWARKQP